MLREQRSILFTEASDNLEESRFSSKKEGFKIRKALRIYEKTKNPIKLSQMKRSVHRLSDNKKIGKIKEKIDIDRQIEYSYKNKPSIIFVVDRNSKCSVKIYPGFDKDTNYYLTSLLYKEGLNIDRMSDWVNQVIDDYEGKK